MSAATGPGDAPGLPATVRQAVSSLAAAAPRGAAITSDLSVDETLNLHAAGWEALELVVGLSAYSVPWGVWNWGQGEIASAAAAHQYAFQRAIARMHAEAAQAGGHGVVGVRVERQVLSTHVDVALMGTAVRPTGASAIAADDVFVSDLSARDFALLAVAGWRPLGLAHGASFVFAPRRSVSAVVQQRTQNIELTNYTEAMYAARESAMERMQSMALALGGTGVVEVKIAEGPMPFAGHAVAFAAWGTVVRPAADAHRRVHPVMVVPLDDPVIAFDASTLA